MRILVTGGAGFIGSHLCEKLSENKENEIVVLDDYSSGSRRNHIEGVQYVEGPTRQISELINFSPEILFHLGEYSRVESSFENIETVIESNHSGTGSVLEFWRRHRCKLVYAGSSTKFASAFIGGVQSPYSWSKSTNTELVKMYANWFDLTYSITYFYNVYGPRELRCGTHATLIGIYADAMQKGEPLPVVSPGTQTRNFTHISDLIDGLLMAAYDDKGDNFGIGSAEIYSVIEVAKLFGGEIKYLEGRRGNRVDSKLMTEKIRLLGWAPKYSLRDYIEQLRDSNWRV